MNTNRSILKNHKKKEESLLNSFREDHLNYRDTGLGSNQRSIEREQKSLSIQMEKEKIKREKNE